MQFEEPHKQKGIRELWRAFSNGELKNLTSCRIDIATGFNEWCLVTSMLMKCLEHQHILDTSGFGYDGEVNGLKARDWLRSAQIVHLHKKLKGLTQEQIDNLDYWNSYPDLISEINLKYPHALLQI